MSSMIVFGIAALLAYWVWYRMLYVPTQENGSAPTLRHRTRGGDALSSRVVRRDGGSSNTLEIDVF